MASSGPKTTVIRNGTLIDGTGKPARRNEAIVIEGNRIKSVGALPPEVTLEDRRILEATDPDVPLDPRGERHMASDEPGIVMRRVIKRLIERHERGAAAE